MHTHIKLIVGLGNPGSEYEKTRHNAGAWFVERLATQYQSLFRLESKFKGRVCTIHVGSHECKLFLPNTFMNVCGSPIKSIAKYYEIATGEILVAHDELDLPPGTARLKKDGGHGGHNGLRDIIEKFTTKDFYRLRIGIGHPGKGGDVTNFVLQRPSRSDQGLIDNSIDESVNVISLLLEGHPQKAMNQLHIQKTENKDGV